MQLTYRGISYQNSLATTTPAIEFVRKYRLSDKPDSNKVAWIRPVKYYTYRGVSYTKQPLANTKTRLLQ